MTKKIRTHEKNQNRMDEYRYWKENYSETSFNGAKVQMAIDSGESAKIMDEGRFQKIHERSNETLQLEKSKAKLYGFVSENPIPVAGKFNAMVETVKKAVPATFIDVKAKRKVKCCLDVTWPWSLGS